MVCLNYDIKRTYKFLLNIKHLFNLNFNKSKLKISINSTSDFECRINKNFLNFNIDNAFVLRTFRNIKVSKISNITVKMSPICSVTDPQILYLYITPDAVQRVTEVDPAVFYVWSNTYWEVNNN